MHCSSLPSPCLPLPSTAYSNGDDGIFAGAGSTVQGNAVRHNSGFGLCLSSDSAFRENVITDNVTGTVTGGGVNLGANYCAGTGLISSTCP